MDQKTSLYKAALMDHFKHPRKKHLGPFSEDKITARGSNPSCGDDIEIGAAFSCCEDSNAIIDVEFRGRGCSVCLAAASMMVDEVSGKTVEDASNLSKVVEDWVKGKSVNDEDIPASLAPLDAVKSHPARKKCVMLSWTALDEVLSLHKEQVL